jgi:GAG-pre-integrase domain
MQMELRGSLERRRYTSMTMEFDLKNKKRLGTISRLNNLYIVNTGQMASAGQHSYLVETKPKSIHLWHPRLGHRGLKNVKKLEGNENLRKAKR